MNPLNWSPLTRGAVVGAVHFVLVGSLAFKLHYDRSTLPRVWARSVAVDPDAPIRGRYVQLRLAVPMPDSRVDFGPARLRVEGNQLLAENDPDPAPVTWTGVTFAGRFGAEALLAPPLAVFIPEHVADPTVRASGEELWVEVSVPRRGPPRPIRLGVRQGDGPIVPL